MFKGPIPSILEVHIIINQKPMIARTHFHCITTWLHALLGEIRPCTCLFCGFG